MSSKVVVVGSLSRDLVAIAPRLPMKGETLRGSDFGMFPGGKGNNQAIACARAGAPCAMVGRVGKDQFGDSLIENLHDNQVDASFVLQDETVGTGIAHIVVSETGDNSIVIIQNANLRLCAADVDEASAIIGGAPLLLLQLEVSFDVCTYAAKKARRAGATVILNPAPAPADGRVPEELLREIDILTPNQTEAHLLTGIEVTDYQSAQRAAQALQKLGPKTVIVTLGELGALIYSTDQSAEVVPAFPVNAIDSTAAGDAFMGAMAAALAGGADLLRSVRFGCAAGALACTKLGAAPSLPYAKEIEELSTSGAVIS